MSDSNFSNKNSENGFPGPCGTFKGRVLPEEAQPIGYAALIASYGLNVPLPRRMVAVGPKHRTYIKGGWRILTPRHQPQPSLAGHMIFALRYEGLDLAVLKHLFLATGATPIKQLVVEAPTGTHSRRIWFLYEWLTGEHLDLADAKQGGYAKVLDEKLQIGIKGVASKRHRLRNNLPGTPAFCPLVFRTDTIARYLDEDLGSSARKQIAAIPKDVLARAAAFLLLKDSQSSFEIEGETASHTRVQRWGSAIAEAGKHPLNIAEFRRLQKLVIGDDRFVKLGLRQEEGFVGEHDRRTGAPLPDHVSAKATNLIDLLDGLVRFSNQSDTTLNPVVAAAILAFGFVYIHPFVDGNGRIHRYLIHHVLAQRGFAPSGMVFPVSAVILERITTYKSVLEDYSRRLLPHIDWLPLPNGNVQIDNETVDFYRYFDATPHVEFLFDCVKQTIDVELPTEAKFLTAYDAFRDDVQVLVDMPERTLNLLFRFLHQNDGKLSKRARAKEFKQLDDGEVTTIEAAYARSYKK